RLLLTDVREAVSQLRDSGAIDLGAALRPLAENVPKLAIHMDVQHPLTVDDPERAHVLLRCAQEAITNTVRHADARNLWLNAVNDGERIILQVRDDGSGTDQLANGNGLQGMRERLRQLGGRLEIESRAGQGFQLTMILPSGANAEPGIPEGVAA
ncbi:MAG: ATP-binding protein, partial [Dokdonella sp.]